MTHSEALRDHLVERYFLGQLEPDEVAGFEEHYFDCTICAEDVRTTASFCDAAKAVFSDRGYSARPERARAAERRRFWTTLLLPQPAWSAAGIFLCTTIWLAGVRLPQLQQQLATLQAPRALSAVVLHAETRGDEAVVTLSRKEPGVLLTLDLNPVTPASGYIAELKREAGEPVFTQRIAAPEPGASLNLFVPSQTLSHPGSYLLVFRADNGSNAPAGDVIGTYRFSVRIT